MAKVLVVVDVQNYFVVEKAIGLPEKIAWHIRESNYDQVLFVKFRNDSDSNFHRLLHFDEVTNAPDTDIHSALHEFATKDNTFEKTTYSAFKTDTFAQHLRTHNVTEIDLCGISLDACILATAYEAFDLGYQVEILDNLCSVSSVRHDLEDSALTIINRNLRPREFRVKRI